MGVSLIYQNVDSNFFWLDIKINTCFNIKYENSPLNSYLVFYPYLDFFYRKWRHWLLQPGKQYVSFSWVSSYLMRMRMAFKSFYINKISKAGDLCPTFFGNFCLIDINPDPNPIHSKHSTTCSVLYNKSA